MLTNEETYKWMTANFKLKELENFCFMMSSMLNYQLFHIRKYCSITDELIEKERGLQYDVDFWKDKYIELITTEKQNETGLSENKG